MFSEDFNEAASWLASAKRVVVFTGAGVSAESGIPTFRDAVGFWSRFTPETFATWQGLLDTANTQPAELTRFLIALLEPIAAARPNPAHLAIAEMDKHASVTVITQNVDGLHQDAGSGRVLEVHGSLLEVVDQEQRRIRNLTRADLVKIVRRLQRAEAHPEKKDLLAWAIRPLASLTPPGGYRPRIVLFGDQMAEPDWSEALQAAEECDCFLTVGTSGTVMPAAWLPSRARVAGAMVIGVGPESGVGDTCLQGQAGEIMPKLVQAAFSDAT